MTHFTVVAMLKAKSGKEAVLRQQLDALLEPTRAESGCLLYDLHRSTEEQGSFLFYETWADRAAWEQHMQTPHLKAFDAAQGELTESWTLFLGEKR